MSTTAEVDPPRYVESIPTATAPVILPGLLTARARFLTGVITGGVLSVIAAGELVLALVVLS